MSNDNAPRLIKQVKVAKKADSTQPEKKTLKPLDKKVVIKVKKKVVVRTTKPHMTVKDNVEDKDLEKKPIAKAPVEKEKGKPASYVKKNESKSKVITSTSRTGGDPLRNGPVIIRRNNLPPINSTKTSSTANSTGPRQVGVVGGKVFTRNRYNKDGNAPRTGYNRNNSGTGGYNNNGGGYNNNRTGGYNNNGGGYNNNRTGGYNNTGGGYNNNRTGGYNNNGGGYNNNRPGGYNNNGGGYNNNRPNFNNRNTTGNSRFPNNSGGNFRRPFNNNQNNSNSRRPNSSEPSPSATFVDLIASKSFVLPWSTCPITVTIGALLSKSSSLTSSVSIIVSS